MFSIQGAVQSYAWGKIGSDSLVAKLLKSSESETFVVKNDLPYAELWMGTHPSGPSIISSPKLGKYHGQPLVSWLKDIPTALGSTSSPSSDLPFLLKVLSVQKALSIQAHPDKSLAEQLHKKFPNVYKDPNHKPEMAIALTEFQALCGFRPLAELQQVFKDVIELVDVLGKDIIEPFLSLNESDENKKSQLHKVFKTLMTCTPSVYEPRITSLSERLKIKEKRQPHEELFLRIIEEFPGDIGCLGLFFFNLLNLKPGQAIYLAANEPHAYLKGDCVECMACSDNVVRAGLTPKYKDVETLCSMLTYETKSAEENIFKGIEEESNVVLFKPEVPDFCMAHIKVPVNTAGQHVPKRKSASIVLVVEGKGTVISKEDPSISLAIVPGSIFFVSANMELEIKPRENSILSVFQAFSDL